MGFIVCGHNRRAMTTWVFQNTKTGEEFEYDTEGFDEALNYLAEDEGEDYVPADWELVDSYQ